MNRTVLLTLAFFTVLFSDAGYAIDDVDFFCHGRLVDEARKTEIPISGGATMKGGFVVFIFVNEFRQLQIIGEVTKVDEGIIFFKPLPNFSLKGAKATEIVINRMKGSITVLFGEYGSAYVLFFEPCTLDIQKPKF